MKNDFTIRDRIATVELTQGLSMTVSIDALPLLAPYRRRAYLRTKAVRDASGTYDKIKATRR
jgi:hypothetical protein